MVKLISIKIAAYLFASILFFAVGSDVQAQVLTLEQLSIDSSIAKEDKAYSIPKRIVVVPIFPPSEIDISDRDWYRGLYYFLIASDNRPGFTDVPFHYLLTREGRVFEGNSGGEERKISVQGIGEDMVVIGYLANRKDTSFDARAESALAELLLAVANRNSIPLNNVSVHAVDFVRDNVATTVRLEKREVFGLWKNSLDRAIASVKASYRPQNKEYKAEVVAVNVTKDAVEPGTNITGQITLKNTGNFGMYYGTVAELIATKVGAGNSIFYSNSGWLSNTQFGVLPENGVLLPGEEATFSFTLAVPLYFGERAEKFDLRTVGGAKIASSEFEVRLNINRPQGTIVEIRPTTTGWLRVRSTPNGVENNEIARVSTGQRFFQLENAGNGFVKIKLNDGREGWISRQYVNYL